MTRHPKIGVCTHFNQSWNPQTIMPLIAESGATWIRDDVNWAEVEPAPGIYQLPKKTRAWIESADALGLKVAAIFNYGNKVYANSYDPDAYAQAAAWFAREMHGKVQAIEILNEPENFGFRKHYGGSWNGVDAQGNVEPWVTQYVTLLNKAAKAIKLANPDIKVIGLGSVPPVTFRQLTMNVASEVDGVVAHPYSPKTGDDLVPYAGSGDMLARDKIVTADKKGTFFSQITMYRTQAAKHNGPGELWLTEWGWPTFQPKNTSSFFEGLSEDTQAKYILRRLVESLSLNVEATFIYDFRDDGKDIHFSLHNFGLLKIDLTPKKSSTAVKRLAALTASYSPSDALNVSVWPTKEQKESTKEIKCYQFASGYQKRLIVLWISDGATAKESSEVVNVRFVPEIPVKKTVLHNIMNGQDQDLPFDMAKHSIVIRDLPISEYPSVLEIAATAE